MLLSSLFYALLLLAGSALGLLTTGVPGSTTATRYEIRQLASKSPRQFTLFLLAMQQYQSTSQNTQTSYYQISGIHGVPRTSFDSVGQCSACTKADGYCPHNSILFLGWHRAYLALFEQQLVAIAKNIASQYPASTRAAYQQAASNLRLPFWDWAAAPPNGGNTLPQQLTAPTVQVSSPTGTKTINNPLYSYKFASTSALVYPPFTSWPVSAHSPTQTRVVNTSNILDRTLSAIQPPMPRRPRANSRKPLLPSTTFEEACRTDCIRSSLLAPPTSKSALTPPPPPNAPTAWNNYTTPSIRLREARQPRIQLFRGET